MFLLYRESPKSGVQKSTRAGASRGLQMEINTLAYKTQNDSIHIFKIKCKKLTDQCLEL